MFKLPKDRFKRYVVYGAMGVAIIFLFSQIIREANIALSDATAAGVVAHRRKLAGQIQMGGARSDPNKQLQRI